MRYETPEQRDKRQEQEGEVYSEMIDTVREEGEFGTELEIHAEACRRLDAMIAERNQEAAENAHSLRMYGL